MKNEKMFYAIFVIITIILFYYNYVTSPEYQVKHHQKILICNGSEIDPNKIVLFDDEKGCWAFTNGWACNCHLEDVKNN